MTTEEANGLTVGVVVLVQVCKFAGVLPDRRGPLAVIGFAASLVLFWNWSNGVFSRATAYELFMAGLNVAAAAAGSFGFVRSGPAALTATKSPPEGPPGAGAEPAVQKVLVEEPRPRFQGE